MIWSHRRELTEKGSRTLRIASDWPLPVPDYLVPLVDKGRIPKSPPKPHYEVLLEMAIAAKRPDDVLHWYDKMQPKGKAESRGWGGYHGWFGGYADRVAEAVAKSHPDRALDIYRRHLNANLTHAQISAYESVAHYLKKMRSILTLLGRRQEWDTLLAEIRATYRNRPRFMEILDKLEDMWQAPFW